MKPKAEKGEVCTEKVRDIGHTLKRLINTCNWYTRRRREREWSKNNM